MERDKKTQRMSGVGKEGEKGKEDRHGVRYGRRMGDCCTFFSCAQCENICLIELEGGRGRRRKAECQETKQRLRLDKVVWIRKERNEEDGKRKEMKQKA